MSCRTEKLGLSAKRHPKSVDTLVWSGRKVSLRIDISVKGDGRYPEFPAQSRDRCVPVHHGRLDRATLRICQG